MRIAIRNLCSRDLGLSVESIYVSKRGEMYLFDVHNGRPTKILLVVRHIICSTVSRAGTAVHSVSHKDW